MLPLLLYVFCKNTRLLPLSKYIFIFCIFLFSYFFVENILVCFSYSFEKICLCCWCYWKGGFYSHRRVDNVWDTIMKKKEKRKKNLKLEIRTKLAMVDRTNQFNFHTLEAVLRFMSCEWLIFYVIMISIFMAEGCWQQQYKHEMSRQIKNHRTHIANSHFHHPPFFYCIRD